jgi:hypothetical protein
MSPLISSIKVSGEGKNWALFIEGKGKPLSAWKLDK